MQRQLATGACPVFLPGLLPPGHAVVLHEVVATGVAALSRPIPSSWLG